MKRILILLAALFALSISAGCSHKAVDNNNSDGIEYPGDLPSGSK